MNTVSFPVLRNTNFRNLWLGQIFSQVGINMLIFVLLLRVYEVTKLNTAVSGLVLMAAIPQVLLGSIAGVFVDRWEKRKVLIWCNLLRAIGVLLFFLSSESLPFVYGLLLILASLTQFFVPAEAPTIPTIVEKPLLLSANSFFTLTFYGSMIAGYVLGGPALRFFGPHNVFLFIAGLLGLAGFFVSRLPKTNLPNLSNLPNWSNLKRDFLEGLDFIKDHDRVAEAILLLTSSQAIVAVLGALAPGFSDRVLKIDLTDASFFVLGPAAVGMIFGALLVGNFTAITTITNFFKKVVKIEPKCYKSTSDRILICNNFQTGKENIINVGILVAGVALLLLSLTYRVAGGQNIFLGIDLLHWAVVLLFLLGAANAFLDVPANTILQEGTTEEVRSRTYGTLMALVGAAGLLPIFFAGLLADFFGVGKVMMLMGGIIAVYGIRRARNFKF